MAGIPLKSGADFYNLEASRMRLHNLGADPTEFGLGQIYYNSSSGNNTSGRARIYTGNGFKSLAFLEDIAAIQEQLDLLTGEVDTDSIISNMKEVSAFLAGFAEDANLMTVLNGKLDKTGGIIEGNGADLLGINRKDGNPSIVFYHNGSTMGRIGFDTSGNPVAQVGGTYYNILTSAGGTIESEYSDALKIKRTGVAGASGIAFYNSTDGLLGNIGVGGSQSPNGKTPYFNDGTTSHTLLHSGNYSNYAYPKDGRGYLTIASNGRPIMANNQGYASYNINGDIEEIIWIDTSNLVQIGGTISKKVNIYGYLTIDGETAIHSGNIGEYNAGGLVSEYLSDVNAAGYNKVFSSGFQATNRPSENYATGLTIYNAELKYTYQLAFSTSGKLFTRYKNNSAWQDWKTIAFTDSNVASATKLETTRTIWGQSFDGTGNVSGDLSSVGNITPSATISFKLGSTIREFAQGYIRRIDVRHIDGTVSGGMDGNLYINYGEGNNSIAKTFILGGNVHIGTTLDDNSGAKLQVKGGISLGANAIYGVQGKKIITSNSGELYFGTSDTTALETIVTGKSLRFRVGANANNVMYITEGGNVGIGTSNPTEKLHVVGNLYVTGNIIADGEVSAGGAAEESGEGGNTGGGSAAFSKTFTPSTTTVSVNHNISSEDVIVQVYEKDATSGKWSVVLVDIEIVDSTRVDLHFGRTETTEHKVVIIG